MKLDTLYKRTRTGAIQYWRVGIGGSNAEPIILKESGQLGTVKPVFHAEPVLEGKQTRTRSQQAEAQAESDWKRKKDEGYKSLEDLGIEAKVRLGGSLEHNLEHALPKFNTDATGNPKPMLAKAAKDLDKIKYPVYLQPKLDGVRCLMIIKTDDLGVSSVTFLSRSGKEYMTLDHIHWQVSKKMLHSDSIILDGEVYSDELSFQEIVSAVKALNPNSAKLHFRAYDIISDEAQSGRMKSLDEIVTAINSQFITLVPTIIVNSKISVKENHDRWVQEGYEGAMIRYFNGMYDQGQRSGSLLKVKEFNETEFDFLHWETGQRKEDLIGVCQMQKGQIFKAKMIGSKISKEILETKAHSLKGEKLTVKHFGYTTDGLPRFPVGKAFRDYE